MGDSTPVAYELLDSGKRDVCACPDQATITCGQLSRQLAGDFSDKSNNKYAPDTGVSQIVMVALQRPSLAAAGPEAPGRAPPADTPSSPCPSPPPKPETRGLDETEPRHRYQGGPPRDDLEGPLRLPRCARSRPARCRHRMPRPWSAQVKSFCVVYRIGVILRGGSGAEGAEIGGVLLFGVGGADEAQPGFGEHVQAEVAPSFGPFVVLLGQHGPDQADQ